MPERGMGRRGDDGQARGGSPPRRAPARSLRASVALVLLVPHLSGCFHYAPVGGTPVPGGADVAVSINDRGRVALAPQLGPGVRQVMGQVLQSTDSALVLSVTSAYYLGTSGPWTWAGERVEIARDLVSEVRERRISRSRTAVLVGLLTAGAVAVSTLAIRGFGADPTGDRPGGGEPGTQ